MKEEIKFIQIATMVSPSHDESWECLFGLDDRGRIWKLYAQPYLKKIEWELVKSPTT